MPTIRGQPNCNETYCKAAIVALECSSNSNRRFTVIVVLNLFDIIPGREKDYAEYLRRVQPILERHNAKVVLYGLTRMIYMGNCNQEYCGLVAYPDVQALQSFSHDEEFLAIRPLRDNSTKNYALSAIESFETMDAAATYLENSQM